MKLYYLWSRCQLSIALILLLGAGMPMAAIGQTISGKVTSADAAEPLVGASIVIDGTVRGVLTDAAGNYEIQAKPGETLVFGYAGYEKQSILVTDQRTINISLASIALEEVVVVGYGTTRKSDLTGAVATVDAKDLTQVSTPDVLQAMQGRVAGVQIVSNSGEPGGGVRVRIRGVSSTNNSDPLYVVDGFQTNDLSFLNPNDIERMEVLKDASATAIYGSRGANGVVLITTKRGQEGKTRIEFSGYAGTMNAWNRLDMMNADEFATLRLEAYANDGVDFSNPETNVEKNVLDFVAGSGYEGTDWQDELLRQGSIHNYTLSLSGGSATNKFSFTGTYFNEEGIVKNTDLQKIFLRLTNDIQVTEWLNAKTSLAYVNTDRTYFNNDYFNGVLALGVRSNPIREAYDDEYDNWGTSGLPEEGSNAARIADEGKRNKGFVDKLVGNVSLNATITEGLTFTSLFAADIRMQHDKGYFPQFFISPEERRDRSQLNERRSENFAWQWSNFVTYEQSFGQNNLSVLVGGELQERVYRDMFVSAFDVLEDENLQFISGSQATDFVASSGQFDEALASVFSRIQYSYDDRYALTVNLRYDGSSRFTPENRWGFFPSFAGRWNIGNESFFEGVGGVSTLAVRGGWGSVGNQNSAQNYGYVTTVNSPFLYVFNDEIVVGSTPTQLSNPNLVWETLTSTNIGIDAGFFNDKLMLTADYFIKQTTDMITTDVLPRFVGAFPARINAGSMTNSGIELGINYRNYDNDFGYEVGINFTSINNVVDSLGQGGPIESGSVSRAGNTTRTEPGFEIAYFYGLQTDGVFDNQGEVEAHAANGQLIQPQAQAGDVRFVDQDGDGDIDGDDRVYLGSGFADFQANLNLAFSYKNVDLRIFATGVFGNELVNGMYQPFHTPLGYSNSTVARLNRWTPDNPTSDEPRMTIVDANQNARFSDLYVEDGSYVRVKNIQLGYTFQATRIGIANLRVYVAGDNLFTFTNYSGWDPEIGELFFSPFFFGVDQANYPQARRLRIGADLRF